MVTANADAGRLAPFRRAVTPFVGKLLLALVVWEGVLVWTYFQTTSASPTGLRYLVYPFVWINAGVLAVAATRTNPGSARHRLVALAVAAPYTLALLVVPGVVQLAIPGLSSLPAETGMQVLWAAPGWGPLVMVQTPVAHLALVPFKLVGHLALGYLAYAAVLAASRSALSGVLGLVTCVSCTAPLFGWLAGLLGAGTAAVATGVHYSIDLGTLTFLASVIALYYGANRNTQP